MNSSCYTKIFIGCFVFIAITAVFRWILLWNIPFTYMDGEYPYWQQQKDYVHTKSDKQEVIFLGDSRMKAAIIPNQLCENAYNLAVGGATTVEMYYSLNSYLKNHPKPEKVFMGFSGMHYQNEFTFYSRNLYFHFIPLNEQIGALSIDCKENGLTFKEKLIDMLKYDFLFPQKYSAACINSKFQRGEWNHSQYQQNVANKGQMSFGTAERNDDLNFEASCNIFNVHPRFDIYMHKIIQLCKNNEIPLFIIQLPMNFSSWNKINESGYSEEFQNYLSDLKKETDISIELIIPKYDPDFFGDDSHLNLRGAEKFTKEIKEKYSL